MFSAFLEMDSELKEESVERKGLEGEPKEKVLKVSIASEQPFIVIPAYNEESKIGTVIEALQRQGYSKIIVVDDGSRDNTTEKAREKHIIVLRHLINRGQGAALKTGIDYALEQGASFIVTFDSDGQHHPEDIPRLLEPLQRGEAEVALGSRFLNENSHPQNSNTPLVRKIFLKGGALVFRTMYGVKLTDSHNGLRALSRKAAQSINITQDKMEHASEIVEEVSRHKLKYKEVPVTITYTEYSLQHGQRTSNAFRILFKMLFNKIVK